MTILNTPLKAYHALILRLAVGLVFGLAIAVMWDTLPHTYPRYPLLWTSIGVDTLALGAFIIWAGAGVMRRVNLTIWSVIALGLIALAAWNRAAHDTGDNFNPFFFNLSFLIYPFLFISHELVASADQSGKWIAPYPTYYDEAWQRGVQLALAVVFTALFWGILALGAVLLNLIGFHWFGDLLKKSLVSWPLSGLALGAAVHLGDSQPKLVAGVRALVLGVLSWLLPVLALIGLLFAVSLCFSGLAPLWKTKAASMTLLGACVGLVLLINAAYQQGDSERKVHIVLKLATRIACGLLLVFAGLAAYSLYLRVHQYGLTPERVLASVGVFIAVLFSLGYACAAALPRGRWMAALEPINVFMAIIMAVTFLCVLTPIADPGRLSVGSQVSRLQGNKIAPDRFDWNLLRFATGTYGLEALKSLKTSGKTDAIRKAATEALTRKDEDRYSRSQDEITPAHPLDPKSMDVVFPKGAAVPQTFLQQPVSDSNDNTPSCLKTDAKTHCQAAVIDLNDDGQAELLVLDDHRITAFAFSGKDWQHTADYIYISDAEVKAFGEGKLSIAKPQWNDVMIGDSRKRLD